MQPYWNLEENHKKFIEDTQKYYKYCPNCKRDTKSNRLYCPACSKRLMIDGLEKYRVRLGSVGINTMKYQQYLHRSFFRCNAPVGYRANVADRLKVKVTQDVIDTAELQLHNLINNIRFVYLDKEYISNGYFNRKYRAISEYKNVTRRLLYNLVLYCISYYIEENKDFRSDAHFYSSMMYNLYTNIDTVAYRILNLSLNNSRDQKYSITAKQHYHFLINIKKIINPILIKCINIE